MADAALLLLSANNVPGALIFITYILSALYLTFRISTSLYRSYTSSSFSPPSRSPSKEPQARVSHPSILLTATLALALAIVSFATLSWHMLSFLLASYTSWSNWHYIPLPSFEEGRKLPYLLWRWAANSRLFRDFAGEILGGKEIGKGSGEAARWWTAGALWWSLGVGLWMGLEGMFVCSLSSCIESCFLPLSFLWWVEICRHDGILGDHCTRIGFRMRFIYMLVYIMN